MMRSESNSKRFPSATDLNESERDRLEKLAFVPWLVRIGLGYVALMIAVIAASQQLAHVVRTHEFAMRSGDGRYWLMGYRDFPLPAILARGQAPGEAEVVDLQGHTLDREHFEDVGSIFGVEWDRYNVHFMYRQGGRTFRTSLELAQ